MGEPSAVRVDSSYAPATERSPVLAFWPPPKGGWLPIASIALIYVSHLLYGALVSDIAMAMGIGVSLLLAAAIIAPELRRDLLRLKGLIAPGALFLAVLVIGCWSLTPWTPGGPHPVWAYIGISPAASTIDKSTTTMELVKLLGLGCFFLVGAVAGARDERGQYAIQLMLIAGAMFALWAFVATFVQLEFYSSHRLQAHFLNANTAGTVMAVLLCLATAYLVRSSLSQPPGSRAMASLVPAAAVFVFAVCLLDTASRGAMLAVLVALIFYVGLQVWSGRLKPSRALLACLAGLLVILALIAFAGGALVDRFAATADASVVRGAVWKAHWQAFLASPLFGYGLGTAETVNKTILTVSNYRYLWNIRAILNVYLEWLEEMGIVGAVPMFLCIGAIIVQTLKGYFRRSRMTGLLAGLLAADVVILVHGATDFGLEVPSVAAFWAWLLGVQFGIAQGTSRR